MFQGLFLVISKIAELSWTLLIKECKKPIKSYQSLLWYRASDKQDAYFDKRRALSCNSQIQNTSQLFFIRKYENKINMKWSASCVTKVSPPMFLRIFSITILSQHVGWDTGQIRHREPHWATIFGHCQPFPPWWTTVHNTTHLRCLDQAVQPVTVMELSRSYFITKLCGQSCPEIINYQIGIFWSFLHIWSFGAKLW